MFICMVIGNLLYALGCFVCAMPKHQPDIFNVCLNKFSIYSLRIIGCLDLLLTLIQCVGESDASMGVATFLGSLTLAAVLVMLTLSYQAHRFIPCVLGLSLFLKYFATLFTG